LLDQVTQLKGLSAARQGGKAGLSQPAVNDDQQLNRYLQQQELELLEMETLNTGVAERARLLAKE